MPTIAVHTLGCKVNQYDSEAMLESFEKAGYESVPFDQDADVYLVNTCTVTGTGDQKSIKLIRRLNREHPDAGIIVAGCLAQRDAEKVALPGVKLIVGVQRRSEVVALYQEAVRRGALIDATAPLKDAPFETLFVSRHEGKTRATMKIQEGCDRYCAYCVIPYVRGPVRSMPLEALRAEARRLAESGYREIVLTGIHLASYGRGMDETLLDAIRAVQETPGVMRIRLGSLEPKVVTEEFARELSGFDKLCPQFHLSLQSGSDGVLKRMHRRYTADEYRQAADTLCAYFENPAITTDVIAGFPGETDEEHAETEAFLRKIGFARIHVFPYSRRSGTVADRLPGQVPEEVKKIRANKLIEIGNQLEIAYVQSLKGAEKEVLFETASPDGGAEGYTREYVRVRADARPGEIRRVRIGETQGTLAVGTILSEERR